MSTKILQAMTKCDEALGKKKNFEEQLKEAKEDLETALQLEYPQYRHVCILHQEIFGRTTQEGLRTFITIF